MAYKAVYSEVCGYWVVLNKKIHFSSGGYGEQEAKEKAKKLNEEIIYKGKRIHPTFDCYVIQTWDGSNWRYLYEAKTIKDAKKSIKQLFKGA